MKRWVRLLLIGLVAGAVLSVHCGPWCLERYQRWKAARAIDSEVRRSLVCQIIPRFGEGRKITSEPDRTKAVDLLANLLSRKSRGERLVRERMPTYLLQYELWDASGNFVGAVYQIYADDPCFVKVVDLQGENSRWFQLPAGSREASKGLPEYWLVEDFVNGLTPDN